MSPVHHSAQDGYSRAVAVYQRGRPDYPEALLPWLEECLGARVGSRVVDLGAGTGKFTRLLQRSGAAVTAVEPVAAMRETLAEQGSGVEIVAGSAESIGLPTAYADALVCAQSFHWFANAEALAEMHRVIKPGGKLGLVWNVRDTRVAWMAAISALFEPFEGDTPRHHTGEWRRVLERSAFGPLHETVIPYAHEGTVHEVIVERFLSVSFIAALPPAERTQVSQRVNDLVRSHPDLKDRERVAAPYQTHAYWCVRS